MKCVMAKDQKVYLKGARVGFVQIGDRAGFDVTFIHPKGSAEAPLSGEGVLIELVQAPPAVIDAFDALAS